MTDEPSSMLLGDCRDVLPTLTEASVDSVVTDPPYELGFMGKAWDRTGVAFDQATWTAVMRVLKPGGYLLAFGGTRTYHRLTCAIEDAGFEIRDCLMWVYGTGFPKGHGCLKPAWEPILLARKPGRGVLPLAIDACRVPAGERPNIASKPKGGAYAGVFREGSVANGTTTQGRWPANVLHDGSDEVMEVFAAFGVRKGAPGGSVRAGVGVLKHGGTNSRPQHSDTGGESVRTGFGDTGTVARFFYCAKASKRERGAGNTHPTVKPLTLCDWLVKLVTPPGGTVLDPFMGSGSTAVAARAAGFKFVGIELDDAHLTIARNRIKNTQTELDL